MNSSRTTVLVDIDEVNLINFLVAEKKFPYTNKKHVDALFQEYPFHVYRKRMVGDSMITIQIPADYYHVLIDYNRVRS